LITISGTRAFARTINRDPRLITHFLSNGNALRCKIDGVDYKLFIKRKVYKFFFTKEFFLYKNSKKISLVGKFILLSGNGNKSNEIKYGQSKWSMGKANGVWANGIGALKQVGFCPSYLGVV